MQNDLMNELIKESQNGISYFDIATAFNFSLEHIDILNSKGKRNFEKLSEQILNSNIQMPYSKAFTKTDLETNKKAAISFFENFIGENTGKALTDLPIIKEKMEMFNGATYFHYDMKQRQITPTRIILFRTDLSYNALSLSHENTHILFNNPAPEPGFHIHYNELLPILIELIATTEFTDTLHDSHLLENYMKIRLKMLKDLVIAYQQGINVQKKLTEPLLPLEYAIHKNYSYIISTIYALHLFELYKENPETMRAIIKECLTHQKTIESMLQTTNVSLKNSDTIKATEKVLK